MSDNDVGEDYFVPLADQRVFGAGLKRKRVAFVPASSDEQTAANVNEQSNAGSRYLSIVMKDSPTSETDSSRDEKPESRKPSAASQPCPICKQPVLDEEVDHHGHERSIAHQVCLEHSLPPSHLDRSHIGIRYMQEYGWDPDSRRGLGVRQEGIRIPIKAVQKKDSAGLGLFAKDEDEMAATNVKRKTPKIHEKKVVKLNAKEVRELQEQKSRRAEKLRQSVYGEDLSQYLGPDV